MAQQQQANDSFNLSNADILSYLQSIPYRLQTFLLEVPINELRDAIEQKERLQDLRFLEGRNRGGDIHRYNVLDYTLNQVIKANYDEKIINYFQYKLASNSSRLENHPQFGMRLVNLYPQKYYVGDHSSHINHAKQIEELYGVNGGRRQQDNDGDEDEGDDADENGNDVDIDADEQDNRQSDEQNNNQEAQIVQNEEQFIVDDSAIEEEQFDLIDDLQAKLRERRRRVRNKRTHIQGEQSTSQKTKSIRKLRSTHKALQVDNSDNENNSPITKRTRRRNMIIESQDDD